MISHYSISRSTLFFRYHLGIVLVPFKSKPFPIYIVLITFFLKTLILSIFLISGYKQIDNSSRETFNDTCEICSPGTYGNHPSRLRCEDCRGGVVCLEGEKTFLLHFNIMVVLSILELHIHILGVFFLQEQLQIILV